MKRFYLQIDVASREFSAQAAEQVAGRRGDPQAATVHRTTRASSRSLSSADAWSALTQALVEQAELTEEDAEALLRPLRADIHSTSTLDDSFFDSVRETVAEHLPTATVPRVPATVGYKDAVTGTKRSKIGAVSHHFPVSGGKMFEPTDPAFIVVGEHM